MERHIPATIALKHLNSALGKLFRRSDHVRSFCIAAQRDDWRMLKYQQHIANLPRFTQLNQPLLQTQPSGIIEPVELEDRNHLQQFLYALIAIPYTLFDASSMASASVGCAWIVHTRSSTVTSNSI